MNAKSIFKKAICPQCRKWECDETGKNAAQCPSCGVQRYLSTKWHCRITRNGKTTVKAISSRRQDAVDYLHAAKDAVRRGALLPGQEKLITWADARTDFTKWIDGSGLAFKTREFYHNCFKHLDRAFNADLQHITVKAVEQYRDARAAVASPKTVAEEIKTLKRIYSLYCRWHSARVAPNLHAVAADLAKVEMPKVNNKRTRFLSQEEVKLLLDNCNVPHLKLAIQIALGTGWRLGMIMSLEWRQIDFINRTVTFQPKDMKSGRVFVAPLMGGIAELLKEWRKTQSQKRISPFVFPSPHEPKQPMADMQTAWDNLIKRCNVKLRAEGKQDFSDVCFHSTRHSFASHFLMNGGDLATLSELLDHASIQITKDRYGHLDGHFKQRAIDAFESVFFSKAE